MKNGVKKLRVLCGAILALASGPSAMPATAADVPGTSCAVFPANNVWNMDIRKLPVHPKSATWKRATRAGTTQLHPDFGPPSYGIPFDVVPSSHAKVSIDFRYDEESDPGPYPFGGDVQIEGGSDRHAIMIDEGTCVLYELFGVRRNEGNPTAGSGAIFDLDSNAHRPAGWTSADAAGLPIFPGLVRYDEVFGRTPGSATPSASPSTARAGATCGRRDTRRASRTPRARRWARGSGSRPGTT